MVHYYIMPITKYRYTSDSTSTKCIIFSIDTIAGNSNSGSNIITLKSENEEVCLQNKGNYHSINHVFLITCRSLTVIAPAVNRLSQIAESTGRDPEENETKFYQSAITKPNQQDSDEVISRIT